MVTYEIKNIKNAKQDFKINSWDELIIQWLISQGQSPSLGELKLKTSRQHIQLYIPEVNKVISFKCERLSPFTIFHFQENIITDCFTLCAIIKSPTKSTIQVINYEKFLVWHDCKMIFPYKSVSGKCLYRTCLNFCVIIRQHAIFNLYKPCILYIGRAYRYPPNTPFYTFF
jgi:hypothetical protein